MDNERDREIGMVIEKVNKYVLNPRGMCSFNYGKRMENERREKLKTNIRSMQYQKKIVTFNDVGLHMLLVVELGDIFGK